MQAPLLPASDPDNVPPRPRGKGENFSSVNAI